MRIELGKITEYQDKQCELFSNYSVSSSLDEYEKRNQFNKDKIINDIYNGKKAEFLVYNLLISRKKELNSPDLNIYEKYNKSYDADLVLNSYDAESVLKALNIHVKSHNVNGIFPISWVFQKNDPLLTEQKDNNFLALVVMNEEINYMYMKKISEVDFKPPLKESLRMTKVCVYEADLKD
jgi:hypothetical protein